MHADAVVLGDAETSWPMVIDDLRKGQLKKVYQSPVTSLNNLNYARDIFAKKNYGIISPVQYSRGCKFSCDFCSVSAFYDKALMQRPIKEIITEIENLQKRHIFFADDNLFHNRILSYEYQ